MAGRQNVNDLARSIGLYDGSAAVPSPQPLTGPHTRSTLSQPASAQPPLQPLSAPHPSLGLPPPDPHATMQAERTRSGSRYASNPTREAIAQLIEGTEAKSSRSSGSGRSSLYSSHSAASFDPSTVDGERSWDSAGSYVRPNSAGSSGRSGTPSGRSGTPIDPRHGAVRTYQYGDDIPREQLPLELRSFGAPPEYAQVMRSPPSSQPGSSVQLGVPPQLTPVAERYRRSDAGQLATTPHLTQAHHRPPMSHGSLHDEQVMAAIMQASAMTQLTPAAVRSLNLEFGAASADSPRGSGRSANADGESAQSESMGGVGGDDSDSQKKHILSDAVIRKLKLKNQQLEKELRDKKKQMEEMTKSIVSWKKRYSPATHAL
jgi:hypothetical protein